MSYSEISLLALILAIDAFSVAAAVGPKCCRKWGALRLSLAFGVFQAVMPLLGILCGKLLLENFPGYDRWIAFLLLEAIGIKIILEAVFERNLEKKRTRNSKSSDPSLGLSLLGLSVATSIDALGAGVALAGRCPNLWITCLTIGLVAAVLTWLGARIGSRAEKYFGSKAEIIGGIVLMLLGLKMLL